MKELIKEAENDHTMGFITDLELYCQVNSILSCEYAALCERKENGEDVPEFFFVEVISDNFSSYLHEYKKTMLELAYLVMENALTEDDKEKARKSLKDNTGAMNSIIYHLCH